MIYHKGRWLIESEIKALLTKLEDLNKELRSEADRVLRKNAELRAKVESAESQKAEYKRLLKAAVEDMTGMQFGEECKVCSKKLLPNECPIHNNVSCILGKDFKWRYADEALALIGEDGDTNG